MSPSPAADNRAVTLDLPGRAVLAVVAGTLLTTAAAPLAAASTPPRAVTAKTTVTTTPAAGMDGGGSVRLLRRTRTAAAEPGPRGRTLWAVPGSQAGAAAARLRPTAPADAAILDRIAATPQGVWLGDWTPAGTVGSRVRAALGPALAHTALVTFVLYAIPHRDCHAAGLTTDAAYRAWIDAVAAGIAGAPALVVVEPDALAMAGCLDAPGLAERTALLRYAVDRLATGSTWVYLDAGHADWLAPATAAARLAAAGVGHARGFSLDVSNFGSTADQSAYARRIGAALGRPTPYVVDVGRNGRGSWSGPLEWCNPPGRALGVLPTTTPSDPSADALLWVKPPGESDGRCRPGEPGAGTFWIDYALGLARAAGW